MILIVCILYESDLLCSSPAICQLCTCCAHVGCRGDKTKSHNSISREDIIFTEKFPLGKAGIIAPSFLKAYPGSAEFLC